MRYVSAILFSIASPIAAANLTNGIDDRLVWYKENAECISVIMVVANPSAGLGTALQREFDPDVYAPPQLESSMQHVDDVLHAQLWSKTYTDEERIELERQVKLITAQAAGPWLMKVQYEGIQNSDDLYRNCLAHFGLD